jgi:hypothetical protein
MTPPPELRIVRRRSGRKRDGFHVSSSFIQHAPRLSSGHACTLLLLTLWGRSAGSGQRWTRALPVRDLALTCRCHLRSIQRLIASLDQRGLIEVRRTGPGLIEVRLKVREWATLPDRGKHTTSSGMKKHFLARM